ncbi:MAG: thioredoxin fold domain-containing protein [Epsilonproteobacteria bacterium]|nr:thioredoxin fold domain-containing protein [Campylobacterota bacterium]
MKKILLNIALATCVFASDKLLPHDKIVDIIKHTPLYTQLMSKKDIKLKGTQKEDFYIITIYDKNMEANFFVTKDYKYTILGTILDNKKRIPIVADYPATKFTGNRATVLNGVVFSFGSGDKDLYVVTDPQCPFCRKFEKLAQKYHLSQKYKIHVIFYPLSFHKDAKAMIYYILDAKTQQQRAKRFHEVLMGSDKYKSFKPSPKELIRLKKELARSKQAAVELNIKGTPSFYDSNLKEIKDRESLFK